MSGEKTEYTREQIDGLIPVFDEQAKRTDGSAQVLYSKDCDVIAKMFRQCLARIDELEAQTTGYAARIKELETQVGDWKARAEAAEKKLAELRKRLKKIEWMGDDNSCPNCGMLCTHGKFHDPNYCWLAAAIKKGE